MEGGEINLYLTADRVGDKSGGGLVTRHESEALRELGSTIVISRESLKHADPKDEPWQWDIAAEPMIPGDVKLAHVYSGTFTRCVSKLKSIGAKVCYTIAAHDVNASKRAHHELGLPFNLPHLTEPQLWDKYAAGYRWADVVVCPSRVAARTVAAYGGIRGKIEVVPHGVDIPAAVTPLPKGFVLGYMGSVGADKGLLYLIRAWKKLRYVDGSILILAGRDSASPWVKALIQGEGGGSVVLSGWVDDVASFYNRISCHVQPSATEGFGLEVIEAQAYGRVSLCSTGAGASDFVFPQYQFPPFDVDALAAKIDEAKTQWDLVKAGRDARKEAAKYTWEKVRAQYKAIWQELLK